ncbi:hypothetical protein CP532_6760 [Ophiocordyceps camponoti-leonardi (nom. inval.)]|nr:hypothetical protein CP532_6760 [Ophiocordyceps camponoti-leonardi (nom. inval.)]
MSGLLSMLPLESAAEGSTTTRNLHYSKRIDFREDATYQRCQSLLPDSSCVAELFSAVGMKHLAAACRPGGKLSGHEPIFFDQRQFIDLERSVVCAKPVWEPGRCVFFNNYAFTPEQYRPICRACFPSKV